MSAIERRLALADGWKDNLKLMEATLMSQTVVNTLGEPTMIRRGAFTVTGLAKSYSFASSAEIPGQWQAFGPLLDALGDGHDGVAYGVIFNGSDEGFDYLTGVELTAGLNLPGKSTQLDIAAQTYAVFQHPGHVSGIRETCNTIWSEWLPASGLQVVKAPWFERYPASFDPQTGSGGLEVWIPVEDAGAG